MGTLQQIVRQLRRSRATDKDIWRANPLQLSTCAIIRDHPRTKEAASLHRHDPSSGVHSRPLYAQFPTSVSMRVVENRLLSPGFPVNSPVSPNHGDSHLKKQIVPPSTASRQTKGPGMEENCFHPRPFRMRSTLVAIAHATNRRFLPFHPHEEHLSCDTTPAHSAGRPSDRCPLTSPALLTVPNPDAPFYR